MELELPDSVRRFLTDEGLIRLSREAAYAAWTGRRDDWQDRSRELFQRAYLGHFSHIDHYVETLVDQYQLDARLDRAIAPPFRAFVDVEVTALARWFVSTGTIFAIQAAPVGVWVFSDDGLTPAG